MPATAGRVRMPANNRVHSSAALQTHGIWQSAIGYDPYAPTNKDDGKKSAQSNTVAAAEPEGENAYASFQGLLQLARITNSNSDEARGACKKCGRVGHLTFQCRNFLSVKDELNRDVQDEDAIREVVLEKLKGEKVKLNGKKNAVESGESSEEEEEESDSSDSDYDSEMERIIADKYGKKTKGKLSSTKVEEEDDEGDEGERRKKRGRSKKRRSSKRENSESEDEDEGGRRRRKKRKEKRNRRDDDSSDDAKERRKKRKSRQEKRRRRSHKHYSEDSSDDSAERRRKRSSRRVSSTSDSDVSGSDDSRVGRDKKRAEKNSRKRRRERDS